MASTYSDLKIELIGTGEQVGTWGSTTNVNLGTALEEAIVGSANISFSSADVTLTLTNTNGTQAARHLRLNLTGTSGGARNLILGSGCQIDKPYIINNGLADTVTVKNTTGTGVAVPAGKSMWVYNNGTNVVKVVNSIDLTADVSGVLPVASGGTGLSALGTGVATALGQNVTGSGGIVLATSAALTSPTLTTPVLGTPSSGTLTSCTGLPLTTGVTGTLPVANGGTGASSLTANNVLLGNGTSALQVVAPGTSGNALVSNGTTWVSSTPAAPAALSTASGSAPSYSARAWASFDGTGTPSIRASGNVSSITDIAAGAYDVNFTTAMADTNYATIVSSFSGPGTGGSPVTIPFANVLGYNGTGTPTVTPATSSIRVTNQGTGSNGTQVDTPYYFVAVFR